MPSAVVRLLCESRSQSRTVRDAATGERPFYWRGSSVKFQLALADQGSFLTAASVGEIIVEVKALGASSLDDSLMRKVFLAGDCDATFVAADWAGGSKQLLEATFTVNEAAIPPGSYRLIVRHVDGDGEENTYLSSELAVLDPQSGSEGIDPPPIAWDYLDGVPVVRYDGPQPLLPAERETARANIGISLSSGGFGAADSGKVMVFGAEGSATATLYLILRDPIDGNAELGLHAYNSVQTIYAINNGWSMNLQFPLLTATRYLTFPDRTGTIATLSGNQAFTGQITLPNQTAATSDAVITRELDAAEVLWNLHRVVRLPYFTNSVSGTGAGAAAHQTMGVSLNCGTSNGSYARAFVGPQINTDPQSTGGVITASQRLRFAAVGEFQALDVANGGKLRFLVGAGFVAPVLADANAFSAAGFGIEWQWSVANSRTEVRLISHNGTTFQASAWVPFRSGYQRRCAFLLDHVGDGSLNLYVAENGPFNLGCPRPGSTPAATLTGVPTGALGGGYVALDAVAASAASAPSITSGLRFKLRDILLLTD